MPVLWPAKLKTVRTSISHGARSAHSIPFSILSFLFFTIHWLVTIANGQLVKEHVRLELIKKEEKTVLFYMIKINVLVVNIVHGHVPTKSHSLKKQQRRFINVSFAQQGWIDLKDQCVSACVLQALLITET